MQVPYRTPYELETVGSEPSLRLEVAVAGASTLYPLDAKPVPVPGKQFVAVTMPGRGKYDDVNRPYLDFQPTSCTAPAAQASSCATIT